MEPQNGGVEVDFPVQLGEFLGSMSIFRGIAGWSSPESAGFELLKLQNQ